MPRDRKGKNRIFLSYKRDSQADELLIQSLLVALRKDHDVFVDKDMIVGTPWAQRIESEIRHSDFLIPLLSSESVHSEMVLGEIRMAHDYAKESHGRPIILPIRVAYRESFSYPLSEYLNPLNWAEWNDEHDTSRVIDEIKRAIKGNALPSFPLDVDRVDEAGSIRQPLHSAQPKNRAAIESPGRSLAANSSMYIERYTDNLALGAIQNQGVTLTIKGPRQMGKSSLLLRTMVAAEKLNKRVAFLDFQLFDKNALKDTDTFFRQFCSWLSFELDLEDRVEEFWKLPFGDSMRCDRYMGNYLLRELDEHLVLALDEVEIVFDAGFRSEFFGLLRVWHNRRRPGKSWKNLDLVLVTSTEPYQLIENLHQSPFNVGEVIQLSDFSYEEVEDLNHRHHSPLNKAELDQLYELVRGHPYLTRKALYTVTSHQLNAEELFSKATDERGPFGDHLHHHLFRMREQYDLIDGLKEVLYSNSCSNEFTYYRLRGAGLVRRVDLKVYPRCKLYEEYFKKHLDI